MLMYLKETAKHPLKATFSNAYFSVDIRIKLINTLLILLSVLSFLPSLISHISSGAKLLGNLYRRQTTQHSKIDLAHRRSVVLPTPIQKQRVFKLLFDR